MISFENVGYKVYDTRKLVNPTVSETPVGILTPLTISEENEMFFNTSADVFEVLTDNLKNLLLTNHGERLGRYFFGANLKPLTIEFTSLDNFDGEAMLRMNTAVRDYMPYVNLTNYSSKPKRDIGNKIIYLDILVGFSVPKLNIPEGYIKLRLSVS